MKIIFYVLLCFWVLPMFGQQQQPNENSNLIKIKNFKSVEFANVIESSKKFSGNEKNTKDLTDMIKTLTDSLAQSIKKNSKFDCANPADTEFVLGDLNVIDDQAYDVTNSLGVNLSLFGVTGKLGKKELLVKKNFYVYKDFSCNDSTTTRVLVGMAMYIYVTELKGDVGANISNISAAVQLGRGKASYRLQLFGVTKNVDFGSLPSSGSLNVENYSKILAAWDNIRGQFSKSFNVDPIFIPKVVATTINVDP